MDGALLRTANDACEHMALREALALSKSAVFTFTASTFALYTVSLCLTFSTKDRFAEIAVHPFSCLDFFFIGSLSHVTPYVASIIHNVEGKQKRNSSL
jgi:hypothetical protein